jgi:hypothetical protein
MKAKKTLTKKSSVEKPKTQKSFSQEFQIETASGDILKIHIKELRRKPKSNLEKKEEKSTKKRTVKKQETPKKLTTNIRKQRKQSEIANEKISKTTSKTNTQTTEEFKKRGRKSSWTDKNLEFLKQHPNMTLKELSEKLGFSTQTIRKQKLSLV